MEMFKYTMFLIVGVLVLAFGIAFLRKICHNSKAKKDEKIFNNYTKVRIGMTKKEVINIFDGKKPRKTSQYFEYKYLYRTSRFWSNTSVNEGEKVQIYFTDGKVSDIKLFDATLTSTTRYY